MSTPNYFESDSDYFPTNNHPNIKLLTEAETKIDHEFGIWTGATGTVRDNSELERLALELDYARMFIEECYEALPLEQRQKLLHGKFIAANACRDASEKIRSLKTNI